MSENKPKNNISIIKRFGFTLAIVNHEKKFDWIKYIIKKLNIINNIDNTFFKSSFSSFLYYLFAIAKVSLLYTISYNKNCI